MSRKIVYPNSTFDRRLVVELDKHEDYEGGAPVMVRLFKRGKEVDSATWNCALSEGTFENYEITSEEYLWLTDENLEETINDFISTLETYQ